MRRFGGLAAQLTAILIAVLTALPAASSGAKVTARAAATLAAEGSTSAAQRLVETYAPIVKMRAQQNGLCDSSEEQYWPPTSVDVVLGNPRVRLLVHDTRGTRLITRAPTAADLAGRGKNEYLDLPGNPLDPGCTYSQDFNVLRRAGKAPAVTYAHLDRQPGHTGLALQYWFYYYFNQFNDLHESDWEGMQITFPADTAAGALASGPDEIVLFQHSGGEHADWNAAKVKKQGTHPVVYSAAGSHATFYSSALWLGNGGNGSGVGCDNTTTPLTTFTPRPILLPNVPPTRGPFAWLSFTGHWGQREAGFNNGPAGPNTKTVWREPFTWMDGSRSSSPKVPASSLMGPSVATEFCGAVATVSGFINLQARTTAGALGLALAGLLVILVPAVLTRWRPVELQPLRKPRALGQLLLVSGRLYWRHAGPLVMIALASLLLIGALDGLGTLVRHAIGASGSGLSSTDSASGSLQISISGGIGRTLATPVVSSVVIVFVRNLEGGRDLGVVALWRPVLRRIWRIIGVELLATILQFGLALTIIGIPYAIKKYVDWQFAQQEVLFEDRSMREALRGSSRAVHGHWWHTAAVAATFWLLGQVPGLVVGWALLFTTLPVTSVNLIGSVIFGLLFPYVGVGRTLLYLDLVAREASDTVGDGRDRRRRGWRRRLAIRPAAAG